MNSELFLAIIFTKATKDCIFILQIYIQFLTVHFANFKLFPSNPPFFTLTSNQKFIFLFYLQMILLLLIISSLNYIFQHQLYVIQYKAISLHLIIYSNVLMHFLLFLHRILYHINPLIFTCFQERRKYKVSMVSEPYISSCFSSDHKMYSNVFSLP